MNVCHKSDHAKKNMSTQFVSSISIFLLCQLLYNMADYCYIYHDLLSDLDEIKHRGRLSRKLSNHEKDKARVLEEYPKAIQAYMSSCICLNISIQNYFLQLIKMLWHVMATKYFYCILNNSTSRCNFRL